METMTRKLANGNDLDREEVDAAAHFLLQENRRDEEKGRFLTALSAKGETSAELTYFVESFLEKAVNPNFDKSQFRGPTIDVCGTGGDKLDLFNVSTTSMFVVAAAGATVIKHGNRGITSKSGGADVLEALGVSIQLPSAMVEDCLKEAGVGFLFAPSYHPAFAQIAPVRKTLAKKGQRTLFNLIGPLLNPAKPDCQLIGVFDQRLCPMFAEILKNLGRARAWVVNGGAANGKSVDEMSTMGLNQVHYSGSEIASREEAIDPKEYSFSQPAVADLQGGDARENAGILTEILAGRELGPKREMVELNAAAAITCAGLAPDLAGGIAKAREVIDNGQALERLEILQKISAS